MVRRVLLRRAACSRASPPCAAIDADPRYALRRSHPVGGYRPRQRGRVRPYGWLPLVAEHEWEPDGEYPLGAVEGPYPALISEDVAERWRLLERFRRQRGPSIGEVAERDELLWLAVEQ